MTHNHWMVILLVLKRAAVISLGSSIPTITWTNDVSMSQ